MLVGYARVSTADQDLTLQTDALTKAGCEKLFTDKVSGAKLKRPGLTEALNFVRAGDTLVIWKLDRLGRSIGGLIELVSCPLLSGPSTITVWTKEGTTNACEEAQARGDYREAT